jgi:2-dehydropantoate 2-reductase
MKIVIYGAGAIGSHIAHCLYSAGHEIFIITRGENYESIKKNGLIVKIHNNKKLISKNKIVENNNFHVLNSLKNLRKISIETIFITVKLKDYNWNLIKKIKPFLNKKTAIITPCTNIPLWWIINNKALDKRFKKFSIYNKYKKKYFNTNNILGMTMWVSAVIEKPGIVNIRHTQRGYPLKSLSKNFSSTADELRKSLKRYSKSPNFY